jgi:cytochrome c biogenesis protein CcdA/glutaredoxin
MKNVLLLILLPLLLLSSAAVFAQEAAMPQAEIHLHLFYGQGCPHCSQVRLFLEDIGSKYPSLIIHEHEVYSDDAGRILFQEMSNNFNVSVEGVPTIFIDDKVIVGFNDAIANLVEDAIKTCLDTDCGDPEQEKGTTETVKMVGESSPSRGSKGGRFTEKLTIPIVIAAAAVDAINPCAFAVLIILMTAALAIANKRRALKFGLAFTISIYISYFLMGLGLFSALQATGISHTFYIIVTILAVIVGLLNIKDYFWYGKGFLMEVPLSWRPKMKKLLNSATSPLGAFVVGFAVSLFELPCTGGPYIVILGLLAQEVTREVGVLYLLLYNLVFVTPLIILSLIIYKGLSTTETLEKIRQEKIRVLHLIAGLLMLCIAIAMILSILNG